MVISKCKWLQGKSFKIMQNLHPPEMDALAKKQLKSYILNYVVYDGVLFG